VSDFAKIFSTAHGQLLVTKAQNDECEPCLTIRVDVDGITAEIKPAWNDNDAGYEQRDRQFDGYGQEDADKTAGQLARMVAGLSA